MVAQYRYLDVLASMSTQAICMRGKRARGLVLHKSKFEYAGGQVLPVCRRPFMLDHTSVCPPGSCCSRPFGLWPVVRETRHDPDAKRPRIAKRWREHRRVKVDVNQGKQKRRRKRSKRSRIVLADPPRIVYRRMCGPSTNAKSSFC